MLEEQTLNYTFAELEVLAKYILEVKGNLYIPTSFELIKIEDKIKKNSLEDVQGYMKKQEFCLVIELIKH